MGQLNALTTFITQLLTEHIGQFNFLGRNMFLSFATIMIVWFGSRTYSILPAMVPDFILPTSQPWS